MKPMDVFRTPAPAAEATCVHVPEQLATPNSDRCEECGSRSSLRMCATCGHVGCCESQAGDAKAHWEATGHEVILSMPVGRGFVWCYRDRRYL